MNLKSGKTGTVVLLTLFLFLNGCNYGSKTTSLKNTSANEEAVYKVTFIELGSVRCIPCQQMQAVMKSIEQKYGSQVKVIFYDVWTDAGSPFGKQYGINAIPTQVFLDETGKEYFRHEGFFAEEELVKILNQKGVK
jgi:thioredoxin 1